MILLSESSKDRGLRPRPEQQLPPALVSRRARENYVQRASLRELFYRDHFDRAGAQASYETPIVHDEAVADVNTVVNICSPRCNDVRSERQLSTATTSGAAQGDIRVLISVRAQTRSQGAPRTRTTLRALRLHLRVCGSSRTAQQRSGVRVRIH
jgi:hypothetical protein